MSCLSVVCFWLVWLYCSSSLMSSTSAGMAVCQLQVWLCCWASLMSSEILGFAVIGRDIASTSFNVKRECTVLLDCSAVKCKCDIV